MNWNKIGFWLVIVLIIYFGLSAYGNYLYRHGNALFGNIIMINLLIIAACRFFRKVWEK